MTSAHLVSNRIETADDTAFVDRSIVEVAKKDGGSIALNSQVFQVMHRLQKHDLRQGQGSDFAGPLWQNFRQLTLLAGYDL